MFNDRSLNTWAGEVVKAAKCRNKQKLLTLKSNIPSSDNDDIADGLTIIDATIHYETGNPCNSVKLLTDILYRYPHCSNLMNLWMNSCIRSDNYAIMLELTCKFLEEKKIWDMEWINTSLRCLARGHFVELQTFFDVLDKTNWINKDIRFSSDMLTATGAIMERNGRIDDALQSYKKATAKLEGLGTAFNYYLACVLNKYGVQYVTPSLPRKNCHFIMSEFCGYEGRFGDTIGQYVMIKCLEKTTGMQAVFPYWYGRRLFVNASEPVVECMADCKYGAQNEYLNGFNKVQLTLDLDTNYLRTEYDTRNTKLFLFNNQGWLDNILRPCDLLVDILHRVQSALKERGNTIISTHVRLRDFKYRCPKNITPFDVYKHWFKDNISHYDKPVIFLATDDEREARAGLGVPNIVTLADLGLKIEPDLEMFYDYAGLCAADVLVSSRSTFCKTSTLFNKNKKELWFSAKGDEPFKLTDVPFL